MTDWVDWNDNVVALYEMVVLDLTNLFVLYIVEGITTQLYIDKKHCKVSSVENLILGSKKVGYFGISFFFEKYHEVNKQ